MNRFFKAYGKDLVLLGLFIALLVVVQLPHCSGSSKGAVKGTASPPATETPAVETATPAQTPNSTTAASPSEIPQESYNPTEDSQQSLSKDVQTSPLKVQGSSEEVVEDYLNDLIREDGAFNPAEEFTVRSFGDYAGIDEKYTNLYCFSATTEYAKAADLQFGGTTLHKAAGDTAYAMAYVEKGGDCWIIHKFVIDGRHLVNDGWVPAGADNL